MQKQSQRRPTTKKNISPEVVRVPFGTVTIYEIDEYELRSLGQGSRDSLYLNFAIFLVSTAVAFLIALLTTSSTISLYTYLFFLVVTVVGFIGSAFLFILWINSRRSVSQVVDRIQSRLPIEQQQHPIAPVKLLRLSDGRILQFTTEKTTPSDSAGDNEHIP